MVKVEVYTINPDKSLSLYTVHRYPKNTQKDNLYSIVDAINFIGGYSKYSVKIVY